MKSVIRSIKPYWVFLIIARKMGWNIPQEKTVEVGKTQPLARYWNRKTFIYCSKDKNSFNRIPKEYQPLMRPLLGKVIGDFICNRIDRFTAELNYNDCYEDIRHIWVDDDGEEDFEVITTNERDNPDDCKLLKDACLTFVELKKYLYKDCADIITFYGWRIVDLKIYDKPKEISEFYQPCSQSKNLNCDWLRKHNICACSNKRFLTRPPQSWYYTEAAQ